MSKYKAGDRVVLEVLSIDGDGYYIVGSEHYSWWASPKNLDEVIKPLSTYTAPLNDKIKKQESEITRLLTENAELKKKYEGLNKALDDFNDDMCKSARDVGQEEAWELAQKIMLSVNHGGYSMDKIKEIFGDVAYYEVMENNTYSEAAAKVAEWEKAKEEICVGDIYSYNGVGNFVICDIDREKDMVKILWDDLSVGTETLNKIKNDYNKTGRHIDIASMLVQIGENNE